MRCTQTIFSIVVFTISVLLVGSKVAAANTSKTDEEGMVRAQAEGVKAQATFISSQAQMVNALSQSTKVRMDARKVLEECRGLSIDNSLKAAEMFYKKREMRETYVAAHARKPQNPENVARYAKARAPKRLGEISLVSVSAQLHWPAVLQRPEFDVFRAQLDRQFAGRSLANSGIGSTLYRETYLVTKQLETELKQRIREMSPAEYVTAKRFIQSVAYEAHFEQHTDRVAVR